MSTGKKIDIEAAPAQMERGLRRDGSLSYARERAIIFRDIAGKRTSCVSSVRNATVPGNTAPIG